MQKKYNSNSLTVSKFCYTHDRDLFSFPVDQKLESINGTLKKIGSELRVGFPKTFFGHLVLRYQLLALNDKEGMKYKNKPFQITDQLDVNLFVDQKESMMI